MAHYEGIFIKNVFVKMTKYTHIRITSIKLKILMHFPLFNMNFYKSTTKCDVIPLYAIGFYFGGKCK